MSLKRNKIEFFQAYILKGLQILIWRQNDRVAKRILHVLEQLEYLFSESVEELSAQESVKEISYMKDDAKTIQ